MLELVNIKRYYTQKKGPTVKALDDVSIVFPEKGMVFILGKSGSGKSTLLNVIGGLDQATEGEIFIKGKSTKKFTQNEFDSYRNTMVGFIFQEYNILNEFTVGQNIGIALELQGEKATNEKINNILNTLDMQGYAHRKPNTLSGGQKQRVAIARALVKNPRIIMADEPTGALDSKTGKQLFETLKKLSADKLVIVVTHDNEFAETFGDRIIEFSDGKIIRDASKVKKQGEKPALTFSEGSISLDAGYELTNEDVAKINEYLRQNRDETLIKVLNEENNFEKTIEPEPYPRTEELDLIKSRMPYKSSLKIGASALKHKTFRLVLSILLATSAFTMFGLTDAMAHFKRTKATVNTMMDLDTEYSSISKVLRVDYESFVMEHEVKLDDSDLIELKKLDNRLDFFPTLELHNNFTSNFYDDGEFNYSNPYRFGTTTVAHMTTEDLSKAKLELLAGNLPSETNEIAVPEYIYESFKYYGYVSGFDQTNKIAINNPADLVNKKMTNGFIVSGVYSTGFNIKRFLKNIKEDADVTQVINMSAFNAYLQSGFNSTLLVNEQFFNTHVAEGRAYALTRSGSTFIDMLDENDTNFYTSDFRRIEKVLTRDDVFLLNGVSADNLAQNDIILGSSSSRFSEMAGGFDASVNTATAAFRADILTSDENDSAIYEMLCDDYITYGFANPSDVPPYSEWSDEQKVTYREYYLDALFGMLYEENPYQSEFSGKSAIFNKVSAQIKNDITPFKVDYVIRDYNEDTPLITRKGLRVVGFTYDYFDYLNNYYELPVYINRDNAATMELVNQGLYQTAVTYHGGSRALIQKLVKLNDLGQKKETGYFYRTNNEAAYLVNNFGSFADIVSGIFIVIGIINAVFASLLFMNFISLSVAFKKQEIGILRAIGARGFDVATIFLNEASIIAAINLVLSFIFSLYFARLINKEIGKGISAYISLVNVGFRQLLLLILIAFGVALIASFIPVYRLSKRKPIDAIKKN